MPDLKKLSSDHCMFSDTQTANGTEPVQVYVKRAPGISRVQAVALNTHDMNGGQACDICMQQKRNFVGQRMLECSRVL